MDYMNILTGALVLGIMGIVFGILLAYASKKFAVEVDPRIPLVREALPGANCGACGFPGCDGFAAAVVEGGARLNGCPIGGAKVAAVITQIMTGGDGAAAAPAKTEAKPAEKKEAAKPAEKAPAKPVAKPEDKKVAEKPSDKPAEKKVEEKAAEKIAEKEVKQPAEPSEKNVPEKAVEKTASEKKEEVNSAEQPAEKKE